MKKIRLSNRLATTARYIKDGAAVIDVGTDHGFLPVFLAQDNRARKITATDIKKGPLTRAKVTAKAYGVFDKIDFLLADGIGGLEGGGYDTVVIAGMGGETIIQILNKAGWTREKNVRLILQPQTKLFELVGWLGRNGFDVFDAALARDEGRLYIILYVGAGSGDALKNPLTILFEKHDKLLPDYLDQLISKRRHALDGLEKSSGETDDALTQNRHALEELIRMKEESEKW